ncbi:ATP synthase subunit I [Spongiibacter nanhainus]
MRWVMTAQQRESRRLSTRLVNTIRPPLLKIYGVQCVLVILASVMALPSGRDNALSLLIGGLISVVPNAYFARQAFRYAGAAHARKVASSFYRGEAGKYAVTLAGFATVFAFYETLNEFILLAAYLVMLLLNILLVAVWRPRSAE